MQLRLRAHQLFARPRTFLGREVSPAAICASVCALYELRVAGARRGSNLRKGGKQSNVFERVPPNLNDACSPQNIWTHNRAGLGWWRAHPLCVSG